MKQLFINLPVKNIEASMQFYTQIGFKVHPLFTFQDQKCMIWNDHIYLMLQTHEMFKKGHNKTLPDTKSNATATFTIPVESIDSLNQIIEAGLKAGGTAPVSLIDEGFMQIGNIEDLDGHNWAIIYLDIGKFKQKTGKC